jgi:hypothetical protein
VNQLRAALYERLRTTSNLGSLLSGTAAIYDTLAPQETDPPYVVFQQQSSVDARTMGGRAWESALYAVKGVTAEHSAAAAGSIAARIDQAIEGLPLTVTGATNLYLRRESKLSYSEVTRGEVFRHEGGIYRVYTQAT